MVQRLTNPDDIDGLVPRVDRLDKILAAKLNRAIQCGERLLRDLKRRLRNVYANVPADTRPAQRLDRAGRGAAGEIQKDEPIRSLRLQKTVKQPVDLLVRHVVQADHLLVRRQSPREKFLIGLHAPLRLRKIYNNMLGQWNVGGCQ